MGFLDFLFNKERADERKLAKLKKTLTHMYVQTGERQYAVQQLRDIGTPEAVDVLMCRFDENAPNTTTDIDEKEYVYATLVEMAKNPDLDVRGIVIDALRKAEEKINWRMKVLTDLLTYDEMAGVVTELLAGCHTEYQRNPEKKQELLLRATEFKDDALAEQCVRFLEDDNETIRFVAVEAAIQQERDAIVEEPLRRRLAEEDSLRILQKIADIFVGKPEWKIPDDEREAVATNLPQGFTLQKDGRITGARA